MKNKTKLSVAILLSLMLVLLTGCQKTAESGGDEVLNEEAEEVLEYEYRDVICDRSITDGQFSARFFRSNYQHRLASKSTVYSGDSTLLIAPDGTTMLIDVNLRPVSGRVLGYLEELGIKKLDYLVFSHTDTDHYGGYRAIVDNLEVGEVWINSSPNWETLSRPEGKCISYIRNKGIPVKVIGKGMEMKFGDVDVKCMWPGPDYEYIDEYGNQNQNMVNNGSLLLRFVYKDSSFLFGGDLYSEGELKIVAEYGKDLKTDIAKMNHHSSVTSSTAKWLKAVDAKLTCGITNTQTAGVNAVIQRFMYYDMQFTVSGHDGTVLVYTDGDGEYDVQVEKERSDPFYPDLNTKDGHFIIK